MSRRRISPQSFIASDVELGLDVHVGTGATIGFSSRIEQGAKILSHASIGANVYIGKGVVVGSGVTVRDHVMVHKGAQLCPGNVRKHSSDARKIGIGSIIGMGVLLPDEVELGQNTVVPTQRTIIAIGHLGAKNRVVTVYGADNGPQYSIGCQIGIPYAYVEESVLKEYRTTDTSAGTYRPYLDVFKRLGDVVQEAYEKEKGLVDELRGQKLAWLHRETSI